MFHRERVIAELEAKRRIIEAYWNDTSDSFSARAKCAR
jgi:hypothetical protein